MRASGLLRERVWGGAKWAARCWPCEGERWAAERARAEGVARGLGRPGREREEWAWVSLSWVWILVSFPFLFPILLLSKSNSNKV